MKLTAEERETIIRRADSDTEWDLFTDNPALRRKLAKLGIPPSGEAEGFYRLPLALISVRRPPRISAEVKAASARRLAELKSIPKPARASE